jgi:O-antigen ligase
MVAAALSVVVVREPRIALVIVGAIAALVGGALRPALVPAALLTVIFFESTVPSSLALLALVAVAGQLALGRRIALAGSPLPWVAAFVLWAFASGLWTSSPQHTVGLLWALGVALCFTLAFATLLVDEADLRLVLAALALLAAAAAAISLIAFEIDETNRATGGQGDPNIFAMYQVIALPFILCLLARAQRGLTRLAAGAAAILVVVSIMTSVSRGGLFALGAVLLLLALMPNLSLFRSRRQRVAVSCAVLAIAAASFGSVSDLFSERFSETEVAAGTGRVNEWRGALTAARERPMLGLGFGAYHAESLDLMRRTPEVDLRRFRLSEEGYRAHNAFLGTLAELGVLGLLLLLGLLVSTLLALRRAAAVARMAGATFTGAVADAAFVGLLGFCVASLFLSSETAYVLWSLVGLSIALSGIAHRASAMPEPADDTLSLRRRSAARLRVATEQLRRTRLGVLGRPHVSDAD